MRFTVNDAHIYENGSFKKGSYTSVELIAAPALESACVDFSSPNSDYYIFPAFCDVHVHLREPGFSSKETIATGTLAAAHGGYSDVCSMPNLNPVPDTPATLQQQLDIIDRDALIRVHPYGAITMCEAGRELADMDGMAANAIAFSDDGRGVQNDEMMRAAMLKAKSLGKMIVAHCEDDELRGVGVIHDGEYAKAHGLPGICSESEWKPIARDIELARETGCAYHVCHISTAESVELIRKAKAEGVDITCETAPHYLVFDESDLQDEGRFKMNPPLRGKRDKEALIAGLIDGTIDMIATDHAPHMAEEKTRGLLKSAMGVTGLEIAFATLYTHLVKPGIISLEKLIEVMAINPRRRFGLPETDDVCVFDLNASYEINDDHFLSMGKFTPFGGQTVYAKNKLTTCGGKIVWMDRN
ncbi:MAG: dihydroorotase [Firmicutes bacterium]|nr:dihydroorotase [Bacillota bacterium]